MTNENFAEVGQILKFAKIKSQICKFDSARENARPNLLDKIIPVKAHQRISALAADAANQLVHVQKLEAVRADKFAHLLGRLVRADELLEARSVDAVALGVF